MKSALETPNPGTYNPKSQTFKILDDKPKSVKKERRKNMSQSIVGTPGGPTLPTVQDESMKKLTSSMIIN